MILFLFWLIHYLYIFSIFFLGGLSDLLKNYPADPGMAYTERVTEENFVPEVFHENESGELDTLYKNVRRHPNEIFKDTLQSLSTLASIPILLCFSIAHANIKLRRNILLDHTGCWSLVNRIYQALQNI